MKTLKYLSGPGYEISMGRAVRQVLTESWRFFEENSSLAGSHRICRIRDPRDRKRPQVPTPDAESYLFGPFRLFPGNGPAPRRPRSAASAKSFRNPSPAGRNPGHLMLKEDLMKALWPETRSSRKSTWRIKSRCSAKLLESAGPAPAMYPDRAETWLSFSSRGNTGLKARACAAGSYAPWRRPRAARSVSSRCRLRLKRRRTIAFLATAFPRQSRVHWQACAR